MKRRNNQKAKKPVFEPFKNPYDGNIHLDSESICSDVTTCNIDELDLGGLNALKEEIEESISDWETLIDIDMSAYERSAFSNSTDRDSLQSDRRAIQTLKVELREVKQRIKMMMISDERGLVVA